MFKTKKHVTGLKVFNLSISLCKQPLSKDVTLHKWVNVIDFYYSP